MVTCQARRLLVWETRPVDEGDLALRNLTYGLFVQHGRAPTSSEVAAGAHVEREDVRAAWRRLHDAHALVLDAVSGEVRMANPFSAIETSYRVHAAGRRWYANCAWDAFGVCAALHVDGRIETACADCGDALAIEVRDERPDDESLLFHSLVAAVHWWDDIVFT
jgi:Alkylmercury lyase